MIDPIGILGLLANLSDEWRDPSEALISPLSDIENEPTYQQAVKDGAEVAWVAERNVRRKHREGWQPLTERDRLGRPTIFMDARKELLLMARWPEGT